MNIILLIIELIVLVTILVGMAYLIHIVHKEKKIISHKYNSPSQENSAILLEKREEFFRINAFFLKMLSEKKSKSNYKRLQKEYMEIGTRLFFYGSENSIRKFLEFKYLSSFVDGSVHEQKITLLWLSEFNILLRKDLGLETHPEQIRDYLNILLSYWDEEKLEEKELDDLKVKLSQSIENYYNIHKTSRQRFTSPPPSSDK